MRALVTGGMGFIGTNFVKMNIGGALNTFDKIVVVDKLTYAGNLDNYSAQELEQFEFVQGDICNAELMMKLVKKSDFVLNFAAESHVDRSIKDSSDFISTNIAGVKTILDCIRKMPDKKLLQVSTDEVYGSINSGSWNEAAPLEPNSPYSASKASGDLLALAFSRTFDLDIRISRCSNNYGPFQYPEKFIPVSILGCIKGNKIPLYGSGQNIREWVHVFDHCRLLDYIVQHGQQAETYNIGSGIEVTNKNLLAMILDHFDMNFNQVEMVADRLGHDLRYSLDSTKIINEIGGYKFIDLKSGLAETIEWYQQNSSWWESDFISR